MEKYVLGFVVCLETERVLLIEKQKPEWQNGFLNGVGGKIELLDGFASQAMSRECREETGIDIANERWRRFCKMTDFNEWECDVFVAISLNEEYQGYKTMESERIVNLSIEELKLTSRQLLGNVVWLLGMALDSLKNDSIEPVTVEYKIGKKSLPL